MFEESVAALPSFWASMNSWFTPTVFFVILNVMIGTIALTSTLANQTKPNNQTDTPQNHPKNLARSPSLLQRVRSINFNAYKQEHQPNLATKNVVASDANNPGIPAVSQYFFNFEDTQNQETLENPSHYMFQDTQNQETLENPPHYMFQDTQNQETLENPSHYMFQDAHQKVTPEELENRFDNEVMNTQNDFKQTQENVEVMEYGSHHFNQENLEKVEEGEEEYGENVDEVESSEEDVFIEVTGHNISRTQSDTKPSAGEIPKKLPRKMRKSASMKSPFGHFEAEEIVETRRPATVRERHVAKVAEPDGEVDAKADDFINKFKQQLKLQRVDSIARYKDMIARGSSK